MVVNKLKGFSNFDISKSLIKKLMSFGWRQRSQIIFIDYGETIVTQSNESNHL